MKHEKTTARGQRKLFWRRMVSHGAISLAILGLSLAIGMWGYTEYEHLAPRDAFLNAAMILGGMGPVKTDLQTPAKSLLAFMRSIQALSSSP